jgi:hypothetical protein
MEEEGMAMKTIEIKVNETVKPRSVTLTLIEKPWYGPQRKRQFTVSERSFLKALQDAKFIAPWTALKP